MAFRTKPFRIRIASLPQPHKISPTVWHRFIALGWLVAIGSRLAEPRCGVDAWLEDGNIRLQDRKAGVEVSIPCSWRAVERAWKFKVGTLKAIGKDLNERQERLLRE